MKYSNEKINSKCRKLLKQIVEIELDMFTRVRSLQPSLCQERPKTFKIMREMTHYVLSENTLKSYLLDLKKALNNNRNLITEKYARMNNQIPPLKDNPIINDIVRIERDWMNDLITQYPLTFKKHSTNFKIYLSCELETYSDETLDLYFRDISNAKEQGRNLAQERFLHLFQEIGYNSIEEVEEKSKINEKST
ncbi:MAG: DUF4125 family protein [Candidatus Hermodarchaeota archaeon]